MCIILTQPFQMSNCEYLMSSFLKLWRNCLLRLEILISLQMLYLNVCTDVYHPQSVFLDVKTGVPNVYHPETDCPDVKTRVLNVYHPQSVILPVKTCLPPIYMLSLQKKLVSRLFTILTQLFRRSKHVY